MDATRILGLSVLLFGLGALVSLLFSRSHRVARAAAGLIGVLASGVGVVAAARSAVEPSASLVLPGALPFGELALHMDGLSTLMVAMIALVSLAVNLYSVSYVGGAPNGNPGLLGFFTNLFVGLMLLVVTASNAFYFLVFWEMMTLVSYFLVTYENRNAQVIRAGYLYMLIAHAGGALIMLAFLVFFITTGSFEFSAFRQAQLTPGLRNLVFLLTFVGFGAKAGMVPLHIWMPPAYSAAPSNASALMAGVMKKTAIYGILRFCVDLLGTSVLWWSMVVLFFGAISVIFGVLFAVSERNLKRVLAYSSAENVGIILLGIGTGMAGLATQAPAVALLGFLAALYHALNHAFFKGLLFLGAGAVEEQLHTSNLNEMGGLGRRMPWTALGFLVGVLAISAIPPLNGFVSEWFTFQAFFTASLGQVFAVRAMLPLCAALLALAGALAAMVAIKMYASAFMGPAHSQRAQRAVEVPTLMRGGMGLLGVGCILLGLGAPLVTPYLATVVIDGLGLPALGVAGETWIYPVDPGQALLSTPLIAILLLSLLIVPLVLVALLSGRAARSRTVEDPWACGYDYSAKMSVSAGSFDQPVAATFRMMYALRAAVQRPMDAIGIWAKRPRDAISRAEPVLERLIKEPTTRSMDYLGHHIQALQMGDVRVYCFYIIITLAILLIVIFK